MNALTLTPMPTRAGTRTMLEAVPGGFDVDAWHVMDRRDNALIEDELLHGGATSKFVYKFNIQGTEVSGISVIGARHLAFHYGGLKHRIVASVRKQGSLFTFTSYPQPGMPMNVQVSSLPELNDEPDHYAAVVEIVDIKTGNAVQMESVENRWEARRDGSLFDRPHYVKIAQAKAFRNGVLALLPQDVQLQWKAKCLELGNTIAISEDVLAEKRAGVLRFAAQQGIPVSRQAVATIGFDQIAGLSDAARGGAGPFRAALEALGMSAGAVPAEPPPPRQPPPAPPRQVQGSQAPAGQQQQQRPPPPPSGQPQQQPSPSGESPAAAAYYTVLDQAGHAVGVHPNARTYAEALVEMLDVAFPPDRTAIVAVNQATIARAADASPEALELLGEFLSPVTDNDAHDALRPIALEHSRGGQPLTGAYIQEVRKALADMPADRLAEFHAVNAPIWTGFPSRARLEVERELTMRCQALGVPVPGVAAPDDTDAVRAAQIMRDLDAAPDVTTLNTIVRQTTFTTPLARFERDRRDLYDQIVRLEAARREEFSRGVAS